MSGIVTDTKKTLGIPDSYSAFDHEVVTHLNTALSVLNQIGVGPEEGVAVEIPDEGQNESDWSVLGLSTTQLSLVKTYIYLKVRILFDPPNTSYHLESLQRQIDQYEFRLQVMADPPPEV